MPTVLITGGHKGLGLEATTKIARAGGFDIVLAGRNLAEVETAARKLGATYGTNIKAIDLDVSSLASVRAGAEVVQQLVRAGAIAPLQVLMLNAGAQFMGPIGYSVDGYEKTFATNCLGHFLLLNLLIKKVQGGGRIVFTASGTHDPETMDGKMVGKALDPDAFALANQGRNGRPDSGGKRYATSKLCTILYAYELHRRLREAGSSIQSIAFDPGLISATGLTRSLPPLAQRISRTSFVAWIVKALGVTMGSIPFSGDALARIAVDPAFATASGEYLQSHNGRLIEAKSSAASRNAALARKLWADSEKLVGIEPRTVDDLLRHAREQREHA